jgi:predicted MFS family arabinose efflux permease
MTALADVAAPARARLLTRPLMVRFVVPAAVIAGAAVFGLGFGVTQNVTQTVMYDRVPESAYGASSALWNLAYDGGMGLGAAGFGMLALHTGYPVAFVLVAAILAAAVLPAVLPAVTRARAAARSG